MGMDAMTVAYPKVLTEEETLDRVLAGSSCARFGDGELRLAQGGQAVSQRSDRNIEGELQMLLRGPTRSLICIPHTRYGPKVRNWMKYQVPQIVRMLNRSREYGSAFISRPDSAPNINKPEYWANIRKLWKGRDVTLVVGTDYGSLNEHMLRDARSVRMIFGPRRDAYSDVSELEQAIGVQPPDRPILMCLGACATVLAERLARKGCWAIDIGHVGKLMPKEYR